MKILNIILPLILLHPSNNALPNKKHQEQNNEVLITTNELKHINSAVEITQKFLSYANSGNLKAAISLCSAKSDKLVQTSEDGDKVLGFSSNSEFKKVWSVENYKIYTIEYKKVKNDKDLYIYVWLSPTSKKRNGDTALIFKPSSGKIVGIVDASE